jgi:hypothetical protein
MLPPEAAGIARSVINSFDDPSGLVHHEVERH